MADPNNATVRSIKPERDEKLVTSLKEWLAEAESGELVGAVLLGNCRGDKVVHRWSGTMPLSLAMLIWEYFKQASLSD
jgi:hypothetical protein